MSRTRRLSSDTGRYVVVGLSLLVAVLGSLAAAAQGQQPLHLYSSSESKDLVLDANGFLFNPRWYGLLSDAAAPRIEERCRFRVATGHLDRRFLTRTGSSCLSGDELKLVYPQPNALPQRFEHLNFQHFFLQPMDGPARDVNTQQTVAYCLAHPQWRLSLQTHKVIGIA